MKTIFLAIFIATSLFLRSVCATEVWDGLPALEPLHLKGIYTGKRVCPMCTHGYDAGLLIFVPESLSADAARTLVRNTKPAALGIESERFRVFVAITGQPSASLLESLVVDDKRWFVMSFQGDGLTHAEKAIGEPLRRDVRAYVFAQRRLLHVLKRDELLGTKLDALHVQSQYAMQLLRVIHPTPVVGNKRDAPQGAMWFAPSKLEPKIKVRPVMDDTTKTVCFVTESGKKMAGALAQVDSMTLKDGIAHLWGRSDSDGCLKFGGVHPSDSIPITLHSNLDPTRHATLLATQLGASQSKIIARVAASQGTGSLHVVGLPCENCENVLQDAPAVPPSSARIAPIDESGQPMHLKGQVVNAAGQPVPGVIVYAYHTDKNGVYQLDDKSKRLKLRGWSMTDKRGKYSFDTIRPGSYPDRSDPAHIHMHIVEVGRCTYYIDDVVFTDDPRLALQKARTDKSPRGGSGVTKPINDATGVWQVTRDIILGREIPGYESCDSHPPRQSR